MAEETKPVSRRDGFTERLKKKYPDREWADDEALFGQINDDYDEYDNTLNEYKDHEQKLLDTFKGNPNGARFLTDMARGEDPWINVIERLGIDGITDLLNDPSKKEAYAEANQKYIERLAQEKELDELYESNLSASLEMLDRVQQERGLGDEVIDAAYDFINAIAKDMLVGKISEETLDMALKAVNHDADVANATDEGMIAGKNAKAEEKLRKPKAGDGTPTLNGANNAPSNHPQRRKNMFDYAQEGAGGQ